jgi:hypothetical protein
MGVIKDRHGTYCARKAVPEKPPGLQAAVARVLDNGKGVQKHLKRSLGTKDLREANIRAKPVLAQFDQIISKAKAFIAANSSPTIKRTSLNDTEIKRMSEYVYANALMWDERFRFGGLDELKRMEVEYLRLEGGPPEPWRTPYEQWPRYGVPRSVHEENHAELLDTLNETRQGAALGDISVVQDHAQEALWALIELDDQSPAYRKLGTACLHAYLRALEAVEKRDAGVTVETPRLAHVGTVAALEGGTLQDALKVGSDTGRGLSEQWTSSS